MPATGPLTESARGDLPATATYDRRSWSWEPESSWTELSCDGVLTICQTRGRRVLRTEIDHYAVQVERDEFLPEGVRSFLLENQLEPDTFGPFRCVVGGMVEQCGCEAGANDRKRVRPTGCKHRDSLRALLASGVI